MFLCELCGKGFAVGIVLQKTFTAKLAKKIRKERERWDEIQFAADSPLEVPDHSGADKEIMLAALSRVHVQLGYARKKVARFAPDAEMAEQLDVEPDTHLENSGSRSRFGRGWLRRTPASNSL